ncbi:MAG: preQ(1) synthase [Planctomycetota bacterium]
MTPPTDERRPEDLPSQSLGKRRDTPFTYAPELLEAIPRTARTEGPELDRWVTLACLRFTALCPVTGQPDWAALTINYIPADHLIESKSLKEYLGSFRMHGGFHEDVCELIVADLVACIAPRYCELVGRFDSRGSIAIWPFVQHARADDPAAQELLATRRAAYAPGRYDAGDAC